jgi:enoyl-CoA hydratase
MENQIEIQYDGKVCTITLNRPSKHNCIRSEMLAHLKEKLYEAEHNPQANVIVITGAGEKAFSTGGDLKEFSGLHQQQVSEWIKLGNEVFNQLENLPKPTIAVINGYAYGGGLELALACDLRIASEQASFCNPELEKGWIPGWGGMTRLRRLVGEAKAKEIIYLSEILSAREALAIGLVNKVFTNSLLADEVARLTEKLSRLDSTVFSLAKAALGDPYRQTTGADLLYDILATGYSRVK